jgi:UPF0755 protein
MKRLAAIFVGTFSSIFLVGAIVFALGILQMYHFWWQSPSDDAELVAFEVPEGTSLSEVAETLEDLDLISSAFWFKAYTVIGGYTKSIQAGLFEVAPGESYATIAELLRDPDQDELSITIPEGYTIAQIGELVMAQFDVTQNEWDVLVGVNSSFESHTLVVLADKPGDVDLEGYLFPDTYRFFASADGEEIVEQLIDTMESRMSIRREASAELTSGHEVLTLASIIQREVMDPDEMAMVADIFLKRLEIGMPLQADSTVNYITGADTPAISLEDRDIDSLYNTYQYAGLPPGPISNPGLDAILATLNPTANGYYYFLTTDEGEVIYATTHDQHVQNKAIYLR